MERLAQRSRLRQGELRAALGGCTSAAPTQGQEVSSSTLRATSEPLQGRKGCARQRVAADHDTFGGRAYVRQMHAWSVAHAIATHVTQVCFHVRLARDLETNVVTLELGGLVKLAASCCEDSG